MTLYATTVLTKDGAGEVTVKQSTTRDRREPPSGF